MVITPDRLVYGNWSRGNFRYGLEASGSGLVAVKNKVAHNVEAGLYADGVLQQSIIYKNEFSRNCGDGFEIEFEDRSDNSVLFNDVCNNTSSGIDVNNGSWGNIIDNNRVRCDDGVGVRLDKDASGNAVRSNKLRDNKAFDIEAEPPADVNNVFDFNKCDRSSSPAICG